MPASADAQDPAKPSERAAVSDLIPAGNALRPRALGPAALALAGLVLLQASDARFAASSVLAIGLTLVAAVGLLDFVGSFDDPLGAKAKPLDAARLRRPALGLLASLGGAFAALRFAVRGSPPLPQLFSALVVTGGALWLLVAGGRMLERVDGGRPLFRRYGFWLLLIALVLYVPRLGSFSLLDPWETHYGEVSREVLSRDDWLSFWWAQDGFFWSKPALDFWLQALSFSVLGVEFLPDHVLTASGLAPEWAARLPVVLLALVASYLFYAAVARMAGRRAGFLSALVLLTAPYWSLLAHQSMTDMPYVACATAAVSLFGLGLTVNERALVLPIALRLGGRTLSLSLYHLLFLLILASALPQLTYLFTRNLSLQLAAPPYGFRFHLDEFYAGSPGNCGRPGNEACREVLPANALFQPAVGALVVALSLGYLLYLNRGERRQQRLCNLGAWYFTALATLAKGAPGLLLPLGTAVGTLFALRRFRELRNSELLGLGLLFACVGLPWYVQAYMRHGEPFTDRLLFHDMYKRAFVHVHDTNSGDDVSFRYYVWQLGYGLFPWSGLSAMGLVSSFATDPRHGRRQVLLALSAIWLVVSFGLFSLSLTKFHHYALPCVPPLAALTGLVLDRALGRQLPRGRRLALHLTASLAAAALMLFGALRLSAGALSGFATSTGGRLEAAPIVGAAYIMLGLLLAWFAARALGREGSGGRAADDAPELGPLAVGAALLGMLVTRDFATALPGDVAGSARLLHLISYNYKRSWPESLNFEAGLGAFGLVAALACAGLALRRLRPQAVVLLCATGVWFCAFTLDVYLPRAARHYGQRELVLRYYRERQGPEQPLVAYQLNWKGENFYTGNRLAAFVSSGAKFKQYLRTERERGRRVQFVITEHARVGALQSELGAKTRLYVLTDRGFNDKFTLVRVDLGA